MSEIDNPKLPILRAHAAAVMRVGKDAADAVLRKHGGRDRGGPGAYKSVPDAKQAACVAELERLAGGPANSGEAVERGLKRLQRSAFANIGTKEPKAPRTPRSFDDLQRDAMARFNSPPRGE